MASRLIRTLTCSVAAVAVGATLGAVPASAQNTAQNSAQNTAQNKAGQEEAPLLIGHRGAAGTAPENTVAAFKDGRASGADFFEIDVQLSADGVPFLFHDDTPARTTNVEEVFPERAGDPITSFTWDELQQLDAGSYFGAEFAGERIPHLDDAAKAATMKTGVYIEIKSPKNSRASSSSSPTSCAPTPSGRSSSRRTRSRSSASTRPPSRTFAQLAPEIVLQQLSGTVPGPAILDRWPASPTRRHQLPHPGRRRTWPHQGRRAGASACTPPTPPRPSSIPSPWASTRVTGDFPIQTARYLDGLKSPSRPLRSGDRRRSQRSGRARMLQPETGEHVVLRNATGHYLDVSGYIIRDAAKPSCWKSATATCWARRRTARLHRSRHQQRGRLLQRRQRIRAEQRRRLGGPVEPAGQLQDVFAN